VVVGKTFHFQELKQEFQAFVINHGTSFSNKMIENNKFHVVLFLVNGDSN
jgi:hypothetical protein